MTEPNRNRYTKTDAVIASLFEAARPNASAFLCSACSQIDDDLRLARIELRADVERAIRLAANPDDLTEIAARVPSLAIAQSRYGLRLHSHCNGPSADLDAPTKPNQEEADDENL